MTTHSQNFFVMKCNFILGKHITFRTHHEISSTLWFSVTPTQAQCQFHMFNSMQWPKHPSCSTGVHSLCAWGALECSARMFALWLVNSCWSSGYRDQSCSSPRTHVTLRHVQADYSDKQILGGVGKTEMSVLFIIIKICLFLCSPLLSPHAHIPPPQSW